MLVFLFFVRARSFHLEEASQIISFSVVGFASRYIHWATTMGRLLGPAICFPHKDGDIPLNVLPIDTTSKLAGLFSTLFLFALSTKQKSYDYHFLKSFDMTVLRSPTSLSRLFFGIFC